MDTQVILMEQTLQYMGSKNPQYTQEIIEEVNEKQQIHNIIKGDKVVGVYAKIDSLDMSKFGNYNN